MDAAILEVGLGGRLDATNVVRAPWACGITPLGYDHMEVLGHTLAEIASEKAGILKPGCPAFTVPQEPEAMAVLQVGPAEAWYWLCSIDEGLTGSSACANRLSSKVHNACAEGGLCGLADRILLGCSLLSTGLWSDGHTVNMPTLPEPMQGSVLARQTRAAQVGAPLTLVPDLAAYEGGAGLKLGLAGAHQRVNAALAVALAGAWEARNAAEISSKRQQQGAGGAGDGGEEGAAAAGRERAQMVAALRLPEAYREGLSACYWPGRAEVRGDTLHRAPLSCMLSPLVHVHQVHFEPAGQHGAQACPHG